jgi:flagellar basal-body rod protein FlgB
MVKNALFDQARLSALQQALQAYAQRHRVVSDNIANVQTEDYAAQEFRFEEYLDRAQHRLQGVKTHSAHLPVGRRPLEVESGQVAPQQNDFDNGVNNVDIDREMADLATTDLSYRLATRLLSMKYRMLRGAITGRMR